MKTVFKENEIGIIEERLSALEDRLKSPHVLNQEGQNSNKISSSMGNSRIIRNT